jgi:heptosyltransferase-1
MPLNPKNILIIKPSSFGDIIQALPVAARLRSCWPSIRISWLVNSRYERLLENNRCIDDIIPFERHLWRRGGNPLKAFESLFHTCRKLRRGRFDTVVDLQGLFRSGFFALMTGATTRVGFANAREGAPLFYSIKVTVPDKDMHSVDRYLLAAGAIGCTGGEVTFPLGVGEDEERWAERFLEEDGIPATAPLVGLSPLARWETKRWPRDYFAKLGDLLVERGAKVIIVGGVSKEGATTAELMKHRPAIAAGITDPLKLAALLQRLAVLVTNDTGPMHLGGAVGTPVVALFGPTNPARTGPHGTKHRVICADVDCRPCYRRACDREVNCMSTITVERVMEAVESIINESRKRSEQGGL